MVELLQTEPAVDCSLVHFVRIWWGWSQVVRQ